MKRIGVLVLSGCMLVAATSCRTATGTGALVGGGLGAGTGAIIGGGKGAIIGGAIGIVGGAIVGNIVDHERERAERDAYYGHRVVVYDVPQDGGAYHRVHCAPCGPTRVRTTVTRYNPSTGYWEVIEETERTVN
jgi:hypothetical protein